MPMRIQNNFSRPLFQTFKAAMTASVHPVTIASLASAMAGTATELFAQGRGPLGVAFSGEGPGRSQPFVDLGVQEFADLRIGQLTPRHLGGAQPSHTTGDCPARRGIHPGVVWCLGVVDRLNAERSAETHVVFRVLRARSSSSCRV